MEADIAALGAVRLLEIVGDLEGISPAAFWQDTKLGVPVLHSFERVAIVSDHSWIKTLANFGQTFVAPEVRTFTSAEVSQAREWLEAN